VQHAGRAIRLGEAQLGQWRVDPRHADTELAHRLQPFLPPPARDDHAGSAALKTRMTKLAQAVDYLDYLWSIRNPRCSTARPSNASNERSPLERCALGTGADRSSPGKRCSAGVGGRKGKFYTPLRDALTGKKVSLPIHYTLALLPKEIADGFVFSRRRSRDVPGDRHRAWSRTCSGSPIPYHLARRVLCSGILAAARLGLWLLGKDKVDISHGADGVTGWWSSG